MLGPLDQDNLAAYLTAFADGELDAAQTLAMWSYLAEHPDRQLALAWLRDQQQLTLAARRMTATATPAELREQIAAMMTPDRQNELAPAALNDDSMKMKIGRARARRRAGYLMALAAGIAIGLMSMAVFMQSRVVAGVLPPKVIVSAGEIHAYCSRLPPALHSATFEATNADLAATMKQALGNGTGAPDLTAAGFVYVGAGPCSAGDIQTVHLLYRSANPRSESAVSLFVQADHGQFAHLELGRTYRVSSPTSPFPMLAWRDGKVVYFLLADEDRAIAAVLKSLRPAASGEVVNGPAQ